MSNVCLPVLVVLLKLYAQTVLKDITLIKTSVSNVSPNVLHVRAVIYVKLVSLGTIIQFRINVRLVKNLALNAQMNFFAQLVLSLILNLQQNVYPHNQIFLMIA